MKQVLGRRNRDGGGHTDVTVGGLFGVLLLALATVVAGCERRASSAAAPTPPVVEVAPPMVSRLNVRPSAVIGLSIARFERRENGQSRPQAGGAEEAQVRPGHGLRVARPKIPGYRCAGVFCGLRVFARLAREADSHRGR